MWEPGMQLILLAPLLLLHWSYSVPLNKLSLPLLTLHIPRVNQLWSVYCMGALFSVLQVVNVKTSVSFSASVKPMLADSP